jgi:hypothetical protein
MSVNDEVPSCALPGGALGACLLVQLGVDFSPEPACCLVEVQCRLAGVAELALLKRAHQVGVIERYASGRLADPVLCHDEPNIAGGLW